MLVCLVKEQVVLVGRGPGGSLSRNQRRHLRRAGALDAVVAGLRATGSAGALPAPPAPVSASGEAMNGEMGGGVSAPAEHQQQQQQEEEEEEKKIKLENM